MSTEFKLHCLLSLISMRMSLTYIGCHEQATEAFGGNLFLHFKMSRRLKPPAQCFLSRILKPAANSAGMHVAN